MAEIRRILCPIDFSQCSERALLYAIGLARWHDAAIDALFVRSSVPSLWSEPATIDLATEQPVPDEAFGSDLEAFLFPAKDAGVPTQATVVAGAPAREILRYAMEHRADIIVMGTHGRHGLDRILLGSVTETVLRRASCPVLTVCHPQRPGPFGEPPFRRILCPVDFSPTARRALAHAVRLAEHADADLTVMHVLPPPYDQALQESYPLLAGDPQAAERSARHRLHDAVPPEARAWFRVHEHVARGETSGEILRAATRISADLVVMGVHGRSAADVLLFGSTTNQVVRRADCPVLTVSGVAVAVPGDTAHRSSELVTS
jgi:nucleotide-binding universal stress UspA family protein